ncbi:hypothetical protein YC2023_076813 [Brassica napus]
MKIYKNREKECNRILIVTGANSLLAPVTTPSLEATDVCGLSGALAKRDWVGESKIWVRFVLQYAGKDGRALLSSSVSWLQLVPVRFCWLVARSVDGISGLTGTVLLNLYAFRSLKEISSELAIRGLYEEDEIDRCTSCTIDRSQDAEGATWFQPTLNPRLHQITRLPLTSF